MGEKEEGGERFFLASNAPECPGLDCVLSYVREVLGNKTGKWKTQASVEFTAVTYEPGETVTDTEAPTMVVPRLREKNRVWDSGLDLLPELIGFGMF